MADYKRRARREAIRAGIPPGAFVRQIRQESGFNPNARSPVGARGIAQFMPATAKGLGINPDNPNQALRGSAKLMASYVKKYGSYRKALIAYNAGPGRVNGPLPAETRNYIKKILPGGEPPRGKRGGGGSSASRSRTITTPGVDRSAERRQVLLAYFAQRGRPGSLLGLSEGLKATKSTPSTTKTVRGSQRRSGTAKTGSGKAGIVEIGKLAQRMGLHVGENPKFGGVHPVHVKGSYHYQNRAVDVSGDPNKMKRFARAVARRYGRKTKELFYNGPGGVNIKNGKRVPKGFVSGHTDHVHVAE